MKIIIFFGILLMYTVITVGSFTLIEGDFKLKLIVSVVLSFILTCVMGIVIGMATLGSL